MKYVWEPDDIWCGRLFWNPHEFNEKNIGYTLTVCFKIGWHISSDLVSQISVLTDGCVYAEETKEKMAESLNAAGYAPLDGETLIKILKLSYQGRIK